MSRKTYTSDTAFQLEMLEPRVMLSGEGIDGMGGGAVAGEIVLMQSEAPQENQEMPLGEADGGAEDFSDLFPALPMSDENPMDSTSFADLPGAAGGLVTGLQALSNWANGVGEQTVPGVSTIPVTGFNAANPNAQRNLNFTGVQILPGALYRVVIDSSIYDVEADGSFNTTGGLVQAFAARINADNQYTAQAFSNTLRLLEGNVDAGSRGAGDLDISVSSLRDWGALSELLPLIDPQAALRAMAEPNVDFPDIPYGSVLDLTRIGSTLDAHVFAPLRTWLNANPNATLAQFTDFIKSIQIAQPSLNLSIDVDNVLGLYEQDLGLDIDEVRFTVPLSYSLTTSYFLDLGAFAGMQGFSLDINSEIEMTFTANVATTLQFGFDFTAAAGNQFFLEWSGTGNDFDVCLEADLNGINATLMAGILSVDVTGGTANLEHCLSFGFDPSLLDANSRITLPDLNFSIGKLDGFLHINTPTISTFEVNLPISADFPGIVLPGQLPSLRLFNTNFRLRLPEIELSDFDRLIDFTSLNPGSLLNLFTHFGDFLRRLPDLPEFDLKLPFTFDLDFGRLMDLPTIFLDGFLSRLRSPEGDLLFGDLQGFLGFAADIVLEGGILKQFSHSYNAVETQLIFTFALETSLLFENQLLGFDFATGPVSLGVSNSTFSLSGEAGLVFEMAIDLTTPSAEIEAEAGFVIPATGILSADAAIEVLLEGGALTQGEAIEFIVEADATNTSLADLVEDINQAISASLLAGLIQAKLSGGKIAFESAFNGPSPSFLLRAPDILGFANASYALHPPGARISLNSLNAHANVELHAAALQASATLGFLDILAGGGEANFCFGVELDFLPNGPAQLFNLFNGFAVDLDHVTPELTFHNDCGELVLRNIIVSNGFTGPPGPGHEIRIRLKDNFSFPGDLLDPDMFEVEFVGDFGDLLKFPDLSFDLVLDLFFDLALRLGDALDIDLFAFNIPYLNLTLGELFDFGQFVLDLALDLQAGGALSIQRFTFLLEDALNLALSATLPDFNVNSSVYLQGDVLRMDFFFEFQQTISRTLNVELPDLGPLVDLQGGVSLDLDFLIRADLRLGLDITDPLSPVFRMYQDSELAVEFLLDVDDAEFLAVIGPLGLFVGPGYVRIHDGGAAPGLQNAYVRLLLTPPSGNSVTLPDAPAAFALSHAAVFESNLPVYFPTRTPANLLFEISLDFNFGNLNFDFDLGDFDFDAFLSGADIFSNLGGSIDLFFLALESLLDTRLFNLKLPFIGGNLRDIGRFLIDLRTELTLVFNALLPPVTVPDVQALLFAAFGPGGLGWLKTLDAGDIDVTILETAGVVEGIEVGMELGGQLELFGAEYAFDLGLPFLGMDLDAGIIISLDWDWNLSFGVRKDSGFYVLADAAEEELLLSLTAVLAPGSEMTGNFGILFFSAETRDHIGPTGLILEIGINFQPGAMGRLAMSSILSGSGVQLRLHGGAEVHLLLELGFASFSGQQIEAIPSFLVDFDLLWSFINFTPADGLALGSAPNISFGNFRLDLGTFFHDFLRPIVAQIDAFIDPLRPVIDFLSQEITPLSWGPLKSLFDANDDGKVTVLDLAQLYGAITPGTHKFIETVVMVANLIDAINNNSAIPGRDSGTYLTLHAGTFNLSSHLDPRTSTAGEQNLNFDTLLAHVDLENQFNSSEHASSAEWFSEVSEAEFEFLLLQPSNLLKLLMGQDVDVFRFSPPSISLEFRFTQSLVIWSPPVVRLVLAGGVGFEAKITFGYDTTGLRRFKQSGDVSDVFGGFYVVAGRDKPLVTLWGEIGGGVSVSFGIGASATVILRVEARLSLFDPGGGKIYFAQIAALIQENGLADTVDCLFEMAIEVTGRVEIRIFLDLLLGTVTLWKFTLGPVTLLGPYYKTGGACFESRIPDRLENFLDGSVTNDSMEDAAFLGFAPGIHLRGASLSRKIDTDWYSFELPKDDTIEIVLRGDREMMVNLYTEDGALIGTAFAGGAATKTIRPGTLFAGKYFLEIRDPQSQTLAPYELDIVPGISSTTAVYYVASGLANDPKVHSFYTLAAGDDTPADAGSAPDRPAASIQRILDLYTLNPGDLILVDTGLYTQSFTVGAGDTGFFILGSSFQQFEDLAETVVFGSFLTRSGNGAIGTILNTSGVTVQGLHFENADIGVHVQDSGNVTLEDLAFDNLETAVLGEGVTANVTIHDSLFTDVRNGINLSNADDARLENLDLLGKDATVEWSGFILQTYAGTAVRVSGDRVQLENVLADKFGRGLHLVNFQDTTLNQWISSDVIESLYFENGANATVTNATLQGVTDAHFGTFSSFEHFTPYGIRLNNVDGFALSNVTHTGHPQFPDYHGSLPYRGLWFENSGNIDISNFNTVRVEQGIVATGLGDFTLTASSLGGGSTLSGAGDLIFSGVVFGEGRIGSSAVNISASNSITVSGSEFKGGANSMAAAGRIDLISNTFEGQSVTRWVYAPGSFAWNSSLHNPGVSLALSAADIFLSGNEFFGAVTGTAVDTITLLNNQITGNLTLNAGGIVQLTGNTLSGATSQVLSSSRLDLLTNTVTSSTSRLVSAGAVLLSPNNSFTSGILYVESGNSTVTFLQNTFTAMTVDIDGAASIVFDENTFANGLVTIANSGTLLFEDNALGNVSLHAELSSTATVQNNTGTGAWVQIMGEGNVLILNNNFAPGFYSQGIRVETSGGVEIEILENNVTQGRITVLADGPVELRNNWVSGSGIFVTNSAHTLLSTNNVEGGIGDAVVLDGLGTGTFRMIRNSVQDGIVNVQAAAELIVERVTVLTLPMPNTFLRSGLRVFDSSNLLILGNTFSDGDYGMHLIRVSDAVVRSNTVTGANYGLRLQGLTSSSTNVLVELNHFAGGSHIGVDLMNTLLADVTVQDNLIETYLQFGVHAAGYAQFWRNEIRNNPAGVRFLPATPGLWDNHIHSNDIGLTGPGFLGNDSRNAIHHNLVYQNQTGILAEAGATIAFNRVYENATGIQSAGSTLIRHNLVYRNTGASILVNGSGVHAHNNTVYSPDGTYGVQVEGGAANVTLRNNIVWSGSGHALSVAYLSDVGFSSDYNNWFTSGAGTLVQWWTKEYDDLLDWRIELQQDLNSIGYTRIDPLLDQPVFVNLAGDDFRIADLTSSTINSGDPTYSFTNEPGPSGGPNGLRINQGAYGDTEEAALSPASYLRLLSPRFYLDWQPTDVRRVIWEAFNVTGNVTLEVHESVLGLEDEITTVNVGNQPAEVDVQPTSWGAFFWSPNMSSISGDNSKAYFLRVKTASLQTQSRETFVVPAATTDFYLAPTGDNRSPGHSPATPKASIYAFLQNYTLAANMTLHVANGVYVTPRDIVISSAPALGGNTAFTLTGPELGTALFNRFDGRSGTTGLILDDADFMIIRNLAFTGGHRGIDIRNGSTFALLENLHVYGHQNIQVHIRGGSARAILENLLVEGGGTHGLVVDLRLDALRDSTIRNHTGTGVRLTGSHSASITGNHIENNGMGGIWVNNTVSGTTTVIGHEDLSLELGNVLLNNAGNQIEAAGGVLVAGNGIYRTPEHAAYHTGRGVLIAGQTVRNNVISGHSTGIEITTTGLIEGNRIFNHSSYGIRLINNGTRSILNNVIHSSQIGIYSSSTWGVNNNVLRNNLVYDQSMFGIHYVQGTNLLLENNTLHLNGADALRLQNLSNTTIRNNIFSVANGRVLHLDVAAQSGLVSDFNLYDLGPGGITGRWAGVDRISFQDWRNASFLDPLSLATDPMFVNPAGTDGVIGYATQTNDGRDDNFHLQSEAGSFHNSALAPVRDLDSNLPGWLVPDLIADVETSPGIDRGFAGSSYANEPASNGGFINLGAYGNTNLASLSPTEYVFLLNPQGGEIRPSGQQFNISWRSHDFTGAVDLLLRRDSEMDPILTIAESVANSGLFLWTVPSVDEAADYRVEVRRNEVDGAFGLSREPFTITEPINVYYVNDGEVIVDGYTTAAGDNGNDGLSAATPKASILALLESYDLSPGDLILVDAGTYDVTVNIALTAAMSGIILRGFHDPDRPELQTVLNRGATATGNYIFSLEGANEITLERLVLTNAHRAVYAGAAQTQNLTISDSLFLNNGQAGIWLEGGNDGILIEDNLFQGASNNQSYGFYYRGGAATVRNNTLTWADNSSAYGIYFNRASAAGVNLIEGNTISGIRFGIYANTFHDGEMLIRDNHITSLNMSAWGISVGGAAVLVRDNTTVQGQYGVQAHSGARVENNTLTSHAYGIALDSGASARGNQIHGGTIGIQAGNSSARIEIQGNWIYNNSGAGITFHPNALIRENVIHGNLVGIHQTGGSANQQALVFNNLVYGNTDLALRVSGQSSEIFVVNNTFVHGAGHTVWVETGGDISFRNNIVVSDGSTALRVDNAAQEAFSADYNLYHLLNGATAFQWGSAIFNTPVDWFYGTGHGAHSLFADPLFTDAGNGDYTLPPNSPGIDAGDPMSEWVREPGANGGRVNIGAYGNTPLATEGNGMSVTVLDPFALTKATEGSTQSIEFLASGFGAGQTAALYNAGSRALGAWAHLVPLQNTGATTIGNHIAVDLSLLAEPVPEAVFRQYRRSNERMDFLLDLPEGDYRFRLHFITNTTSASQVFNVEVDGLQVLANYNVYQAAGDTYRAVSEDVFVQVGAGGEATVLSMAPTSGSFYFAGMEVFQTYTDAPDGNFTVEVSYNNGVDYEQVATGVTLDSRGIGRTSWVPTTATAGATALIRVVSEGPENILAVSQPFLVANAGSEFYVNDGSLLHDVYTTAVGNNLNSGKSPDSPMASLEALLAAYTFSPGDTIHVDSGTYLISRNILMSEPLSGVRILGAFDVDTPDAVTTLDRDNRSTGAYVFEFSGASDVELGQLVFTNAFRAIHADSAAAHNLEVRDSFFVNNGDAGIHIGTNNTGFVLEDSVFQGTNTTNAAGGGQLKGLFFNGTGAVIRNNSFSWGSNTSAIAIQFSGTGTTQGVYRVENNSITGSRTGIIAQTFNDGDMEIRGNTITHLVSTSTAITASGSGVKVLENILNGNHTGINASGETWIEGNLLSNHSSYGIRAATGTVRGNTVQNSTRGIQHNSGNVLSIENNVVSGNSIYGIQFEQNAQAIGNRVFANGVGMRFTPSSSGVGLARHNVIYGNSTTGLQVQGGNGVLAFHNNTIVQAGPDSRAIHVVSGALTDLRNNILSVDNATALLVDAAAAPNTLENYNLIHLTNGAVARDWEGYAPSESSEFTYQIGQGSHSILADPLFVDAAADDFRVLANSPAINAGDPWTAWLLETGHHGGRVNIGAEGHSPDAVPGADPNPIQLLNLVETTKLVQGQTYPIEFLSSGFGDGQSALFHNLGNSHVEGWLRLLGVSGGYNNNISVNTALDLSFAMDPAPEGVYRQFLSQGSTPLTIPVVLPDGAYRLRLHFITTDASVSQRFDILVDGEVERANFSIFEAAGAEHRAHVEEIDVEVVDGMLLLSLSPVASGHTARIAGLEVMRLYADAPDETFTVEVSLDNGDSYQTIATGVTLNRRGIGTVNWTPEAPTLGRQALVRVSSEGPVAAVGVSVPFLVANAGNLFYVNDGSQANDVHTTAVGNNLNSGKDPSSPMASLEALLSVYNPGDGDIVFVDSGTYLLNRNLLLTAANSGLTLRGAVDAENPDALTVLDRNLRITGAAVFELVGVKNLTLRDFQITGAHTGILVPTASSAAAGTENVLLDGLRIYHNTQYGLRIQNLNNLFTVRNSRFEGLGEGYGIATRQEFGIHAYAGTLLVEDSIFSRNFIYGIWLQNNTLSGPRVIRRVMVERSNSGIYANVGDVRIEDSLIRDNRNIGVSIQSSQSVLTGSELYGNGFNQASGAAVIVSGGSLVENNLIHGNRRGVDVSQTGNILNNEIYLNEEGIYHSPGSLGSGSLFEGNRIYANSVHGIHLRFGSATVRGNILYSQPYGIAKTTANPFGGLIENNVFFDHAVAAISVNNGSGNFRVVNNTIYEEAGIGIQLTNTSAARMLNNIIKVNAGFGIAVDAASTSNVVSDYNLFHHTGSPAARVGEWGEVSHATLAAWQAASGRDTHSLFADPLFFDPIGADDVLGYAEVDGFFVDGGLDNNFHLLKNSPAIDRGSSLWSTRTDHDLDPRLDDTATPDQGGVLYAITLLEESLFDADRGTAQGWNNSNNLRTIDLPFAFTFYDLEFDSIQLSVYGQIGFSSVGINSSSNSTTTLMANRWLNGLWDRIDLNGAGRDIFIDTTEAGEIYIRWEGRNQVDGSNVRYAILLSEDGAIRLDYGEGNGNLTPTVGLSHGNDLDYSLVPGYDGAANLNNAPSVLFSPVAGITDIGAYEFKSLSSDNTPPTVLGTLPLEIEANGVLVAFTPWIALDFSEEMDSIDAVSPAAIELLRDADENGIFNSADQVILLTPVYDPVLRRITLFVEGDELPEGDYRLRVRSANLRDLAGNALDGNNDGLSGGDYLRFFTVIHPPAVIEEIIINEGASQRSMLTQITVRFDRDLQPESAPDTIRVLNRNTNTDMQTTQTWDAADRTVTLTFPTYAGASLPDGLYTLVIDGDSVSGRGLDGNGDGSAGGFHTLDFHRLFGDSSGNGFVSNLDVIRFRRALNRSAGQSGYDSAFDAEATGTVTSSDRDAFLARTVVFLDPAAAPPVVLRATTPIVATLGDTVTFRVFVHAPVPVTFVWSFDGIELAAGLDLYHFTLADLTIPDFGGYTVQILSATGDLPPLLVTLELAE